MEKPIKMDDLGVPLFLETPIFKAGVTFSKAHHFGVLLPLVFGGVMDLLVDISNLSWSPQISGSLNAGKKNNNKNPSRKVGRVRLFFIIHSKKIHMFDLEGI